MKALNLTESEESVLRTAVSNYLLDRFKDMHLPDPDVRKRHAIINISIATDLLDQINAIEQVTL